MFVVSLTVVATAVAATPGTADLHWTNASTLTVGGRGFNDTVSFWNRLPASAGLPSAGINKNVYPLSKDSAGMSVRFTTNSETIGVRYTLISAAIDMWHMPSTGVSGADLYVFDPTANRRAGSWRWVATCKVVAPTASGDKPTVNSAITFPLDTRPPGFGGKVRYKLHLPTYNGVQDDVEIGVEEGASISRDEAASAEPRPIVWYGTSIAQGCCASRPGQIFTNQIARRLSPNRDVINLAFSGSGIMNMGVTKLIATLDVAMIVIDCSWNMDAALIKTNMAPLVSYLRSNGHATTPIVMVESTTAGQNWINPNITPGCSAISCEQAANRAAFQAAYSAILGQTGDKNLYRVSGDALYHHEPNGTDLKWESTYEDPTVGGLHPTDLGHTRIAEFYQEFLPPLLAASDADSAPRGSRATNTKDSIRKTQDAVQQHANEEPPCLEELEGLVRSHFTSPPPVGYIETDFRKLGVHGRAFNDTAAGHYYSRLPAAAEKDVTSAVWSLSLMSTNQYVRFVTDAPTLTVKYETQAPCEGLWHMPTSGTCYLDLYAYDEAVKSWRHVGPINPNGNSGLYPQRMVSLRP